MDDRHLDAAIDDVAREMTAGEPDAAFRARVLARIDSGFGIRGSGFARDSGFGRWRPAVAALAAAAALVAAVVVFRHEAPADRGARQAAPAAPSTASWAAPAASAGPEGPALQPSVDSQPRGATVRLKADTTYREALKPASEIDALAPPPLVPFPLDVTSIAVGALPPADSIQLDKLEPITPIAVIPLGEGDRP